MTQYNQRLHWISGEDRLEAIVTMSWPKNDASDALAPMVNQVIEIRRASKADAVDIADVLLSQAPERGDRLVREKLDSAVVGALANCDKGFFAVARIEGECAGVAYVSLMWSLEHGGQAAWLEELRIRTAFQGFGISAQLFQYVLRECKGLGCRALDLEIDSADEDMRAIYERNGFRALPRQRMIKGLDGCSR